MQRFMSLRKSKRKRAKGASAKAHKGKKVVSIGPPRARAIARERKKREKWLLEFVRSNLVNENIPSDVEFRFRQRRRFAELNAELNQKGMLDNSASGEKKLQRSGSPLLRPLSSDAQYVMLGFGATSCEDGRRPVGRPRSDFNDDIRAMANALWATGNWTMKEVAEEIRKFTGLGVEYINAEKCSNLIKPSRNKPTRKRS